MDRQANIDRFEAEMAKVSREGANKLIKRIVAAGAKRVDVASPVFPDTSVARVGKQTISYGGIEND